MGLNMYLTAKRVLDEPLAVKGFDPVAKIDAVIVNIGEWRKALHIHQWFVKHVQQGQDNCTAYWVQRDVLKQLLKVCNRVIQNRHEAETLLPSFGYGYDETYFDQLLQTVNMIKTSMTLPDCWEIYYDSFW
jgi:hypothetical protein